jgi:hypothetical protein
MDNMLTPFQMLTVKAYRFVKSTGLKPAEDFGLDKTNVVVEFIPISVAQQYDQELVEDWEDYSAKSDKVKLTRSEDARSPKI